MFVFSAKTDEVLKAKVAKREEEAKKKLEEGRFALLGLICLQHLNIDVKSNPTVADYVVTP